MKMIFVWSGKALYSEQRSFKRHHYFRDFLLLIVAALLSFHCAILSIVVACVCIMYYTQTFKAKLKSSEI